MSKFYSNKLQFTCSELVLLLTVLHVGHNSQNLPKLGENLQ